MAVNPVTDTIYVANFNSANVTVFDGANNTTTTVAVGTNPAAVAVNPLTNTIYVANYGGASVSVIDGANNTVTYTVAAGTNPYFLDINPVSNKIYVANVGSAGVMVIDGVTNTPFFVGAGTNPYGVAVNAATGTVYVANYNSNNVTALPHRLREHPQIWGRENTRNPAFQPPAFGDTMLRPHHQTLGRPLHGPMQEFFRASCKERQLLSPGVNCSDGWQHGSVARSFRNHCTAALYLCRTTANPVVHDRGRISGGPCRLCRSGFSRFHLVLHA